MSVDVFLGLPFNIASYAILLEVFANILGKKPRMLIGDLTNVHIYSDHIEQCRTLLSREPRDLPKLKINKQITMEDISIGKFLPKDIFEVIGYDPHPKLTGAMAV